MHTTACARQARPTLASVLEELQGRILLAVDQTAQAGARRPAPTAWGWRDAAVRRLLSPDPVAAAPAAASAAAPAATEGEATQDAAQGAAPGAAQRGRRLSYRL